MATTTTKEFNVQGFHCTGCADNLGKALRLIEGVIKADADYVGGHVMVRFDPARVSDDAIREQIRTAGFETG